MYKGMKSKYVKTFKSFKRLKWLFFSEEGPNKTSFFTDVIYYNQKLATECNSQKIAEIANSILQEEFSDILKDNAYYELLMYGLTNRLCTMQSIKNVLSYKKENNIKQIKDICFNNGEVQLTCLI